MKPNTRTIRSLHGATIPQQLRFGKRLRLSSLAAVACLLLFAARLPAQQSNPSEDQVKAAYLYNFGKYVKWPPASTSAQGSSFVICALGEGSLDSFMQSTLAGKTLDGKPVIVKRIAKTQEASECRILFIDAGEEKHLREILTTLRRESVLTVSDIPDFSKRGGMIQFVLQGSTVRFEINRASAEGSGLILSSELLKVAIAIRDGDQTGEQ